MEFDNKLQDEFKRVEGYYQKGSKMLHKPVSSKRKNSDNMEKNYAEWKPRSSWLSTLRSDSSTFKRESSTINTESSKDRIRKSIRNIMTITEGNKASTLNSDVETIKSNEILTDNIWKKSNVSIKQSKNLPQTIKKNINLPKMINEYIKFNLGVLTRNLGS